MHGFKESDIFINPNLEVYIRYHGTLAEHIRYPLWISKTLQSCFLQWIDGDDLSTFFFSLLKCCEHTGMVGAWILAQDHDDLSFIQVIERY